MGIALLLAVCRCGVFCSSCKWQSGPWGAVSVCPPGRRLGTLVVAPRPIAGTSAGAVSAQSPSANRHLRHAGCPLSCHACDLAS